MRVSSLVVVVVMLVAVDGGGLGTLAGADTPAPVPTLGSLEAKRRCSTRLYLEPSIMFGVARQGPVVRVHNALGLVYAHCRDGVASFRVRGGVFVQGGSEAIGDAFTAGGELEYDVPMTRGELGARVMLGKSLGNQDVLLVGAGVRRRFGPVFFGADLVYSGRGDPGQGSAFAAFGSIGFSGKAGFAATGVELLILLVMLSQVRMT